MPKTPKKDTILTRQTVIVSAVRTAIGDFGGMLSGIPPTELGAIVIREALTRANVAGVDVGQVIMGHVIHTEPKDMYLSRVSAIAAGVSATAPALTVNRLCGSGLQAVVNAHEQIVLGNVEIAVAGGAESMSRTGHLATAIRPGQKMGHVALVDMMVGALTDPFGSGHMGMTAENISDRKGIDRATQDAIALESHQRAALAIAERRFSAQIVPVKVQLGDTEVLFDTDEHVRVGLTSEDLATLRPAFRKEGSVTAGNSSGINDGAAALVLMEQETAFARGATPLARIVATGLGGVAPEVMGLGPIPASEQALLRAGLTVADLDLIESNEAFAAQACAVADGLGLDQAKVNPNGGAIAIGHPIGASGAVILTKLVHELQRIGGRYGLATMCIGGGQGIAMIIERM